MSAKYDYNIITEKLNPPIGGVYRYAAKLNAFVRLIEGGGTERVQATLGERYGKTEEEAYRKMQSAVEEWIEGHP